MTSDASEDRAFMFDRAAETMPRAELAALQLQRLQWTLQHAYENVPHYRRVFDAKGVHPSDCKSLADIAVSDPAAFAAVAERAKAALESDAEAA